MCIQMGLAMIICVTLATRSPSYLLGCPWLAMTNWFLEVPFICDLWHYFMRFLISLEQNSLISLDFWFPSGAVYDSKPLLVTTALDQLAFPLHLLWLFEWHRRQSALFQLRDTMSLTLFFFLWGGMKLLLMPLHNMHISVHTSFRCIPATNFYIYMPPVTFHVLPKCFKTLLSELLTLLFPCYILDSFVPSSMPPLTFDRDYQYNP